MNYSLKCIIYSLHFTRLNPFLNLLKYYKILANCHTQLNSKDKKIKEIFNFSWIGNNFKQQGSLNSQTKRIKKSQKIEKFMDFLSFIFLFSKFSQIIPKYTKSPVEFVD